MEILIEEAPQLIISLVLIIASTLLIAMRIATVIEGMPLLLVVTAYWIGNGTSRLVARKVEQTLTTPQVDQLKNIIQQTPLAAVPLPPIDPRSIIDPQK